jgi:hypothetical protein
MEHLLSSSLNGNLTTWGPNYNPGVNFLIECTLPHCIKKLILMVPINVSSHDLQENHFANTKLDNVTVTNTN